MTGRVSSSLRQGIWMMSFMRRPRAKYRRGSGGSSVAANLARRMSARRSRLRREGPALALLAGISVVGLVLRYQHLDYGLPYVYNVDEGSHFTSRAVAMFGGDPDPGYFQNPSAFTYLVHVALRFKYGGWWPFGNFDDVIQHFARDPSGIYVAARRARGRALRRRRRRRSTPSAGACGTGARASSRRR